VSHVCPRCGADHDPGSPCPELHIASGEDPFGVKDNARIGTRIEVYELVERIGDGGMGVVYRARDTRLGHHVALKLLHPQLTCVPEVVERFFREAKATAELRNRHIVRARYFGRTENNDCFLVMELLHGKSLRDLLREQRPEPLPLKRTLHIAEQTAEALRSAHDQGVVHRDLKPGNILLVRHGDDPDFVKVLDFGIAKIAEAGGPALTRTGMILGSPAYMAPEQASGKPVDHRADVYSLGIVLYEMLVGESPFAGMSASQALLSQISVEPTPPRERRPEIPESVEQVVLGCLAKLPEDRPQSMSELQTALRRLRDLPPPGAPPAPLKAAATVAGKPRPPRRRRRSRWLGVIAAVLVAGSAAAYLSYQARRGSDLPTAPASADGAARKPDARVKVAAAPRDARVPDQASVATAAADLGAPDSEPSGLEEIADDSPDEIPASAPTQEQPQVVILSTPEGAEVLDDGKSLGKTPLTLESARPMQLLVKLAGHLPVRLSISKNTTGILTADLIEEEEPAAKAPAPKAKRSSRHKPARRHKRSRRRRYRIHSLSTLKRLYRRRRVSRATYRRARRSLLKQRNRRIALISRLYRKRRLSRRQYRRYVAAIKRHYR